MAKYVMDVSSDTKHESEPIMIATLSPPALVAFVGFHLLLGFLVVAGAALYFNPQLWFYLFAVLFGLLACFAARASSPRRLPETFNLEEK